MTAVVKADADRLTQVVLNLLANALNYAPGQQGGVALSNGAMAPALVF